MNAYSSSRIKSPAGINRDATRFQDLGQAAQAHAEIESEDHVALLRSRRKYKSLYWNIYDRV